MLTIFGRLTNLVDPTSSRRIVLIVFLKTCSIKHCLQVLVVQNKFVTYFCFEVLNFSNLEEPKEFIDTIHTQQIYILQESSLAPVKRI